MLPFTEGEQVGPNAFYWNRTMTTYYWSSHFPNNGNDARLRNCDVTSIYDNLLADDAVVQQTADADQGMLVIC